MDYYVHKTTRQREEQKQQDLINEGGLPGQSAESGKTVIDRLDDFCYGPFFNFFASIVLLCILIQNRDAATPDIMHIITNLETDEVHYMWIMLLWLTFKCYLVPDYNTYN